MCRERNLPSGSGAPSLRNRLIQDDTNIAIGSPREFKIKRTKARGPRVGVKRKAVIGDDSGEEQGRKCVRVDS